MPRFYFFRDAKSLNHTKAGNFNQTSSSLECPRVNLRLGRSQQHQQHLRAEQSDDIKTQAVVCYFVETSPLARYLSLLCRSFRRALTSDSKPSSFCSASSSRFRSRSFGSLADIKSALSIRNRMVGMSLLPSSATDSASATQG